LESALRQQFVDGLEQMKLHLPDTAVDQSIAYLLLLHKWNKTHNLTAVRDPLEMVRRHLHDSLSVLPAVEAGLSGQTETTAGLLDVGAGAGLPGIPLAIAKPHLNVTLIDSVQKKTQFMLFAAAELGLSNVQVMHQRIETLTHAVGYPLIVARAFASIEKLCDLTAHLLAEDGAILAMTGQQPDAMQRQSLQNYRVGQAVIKLCDVQKLFVPGETAERNIVVLQHSAH